MRIIPFVTSQRKLKSLTLLGPGIIIFFWFAVADLGLVSPLILPSPQAVVGRIGDLGVNLLWHTVATYARILTCFAVGGLIGLSLGIIMQYSQAAYILLDGVIESWRPIPIIALIPFTILLFGFSEIGKIVVGSLGVSLVILVETVEGIGRTPRALLLLGTTAGLSRCEIFSGLILPALLPQLRAGARVALAVAATLVIATEFMGATYGLGYLINTARVTLSTSTIFLCVLILGLIGASFDMLLRRVFDRISWWEVAQPAPQG